MSELKKLEKTLTHIFHDLQRQRTEIAEVHEKEYQRLRKACSENVHDLGLGGIFANILAAPLMHLSNKCQAHFADAACAKEQGRVIKEINAIRHAAPHPV